MAAESPFRQQIVTKYRNARYGSESGESIVARACWLNWVFPKKIVRRAVTLLLAAGLALGAGCSEDHKDPRENYNYDTSTGGVAIYTCDEGSGFLDCPFEGIAEFCVNRVPTRIDCTEYCQEEYGSEYYSKNCNIKNPDNVCGCVQANCSIDRPIVCDGSEQYLWKCADGELQKISCWDECPFFEDESLTKGLSYPYCDYYLGDCICRYERLDSHQIQCGSDDSRCVDDAIWLSCEKQRYVPLVCDDYCRNTYGEHYYASGCDDDAEEPCQCEYGLTDGILNECQPGDVYCPDGNHLATCESEEVHIILDCNAYCREEFGEDSVSLQGCEAYKNLENPCSCSMGESPSSPSQTEADCLVAECESGKTYCTDGGRIVVCQNESRQTAYSCSVYCPTMYGADSEALGVCDALSPDNPCHCTYTDLFRMPPILPRPPHLLDEE